MSWREKAAVLALAAMFCWPWALALVVGPNSHPWLRNATLMGVVTRPPAAPLSWTSLRDHKWQTWREDEAIHGLPGREAVIRLTNEAHFRLFRETGTLNTLSVGRQDSLFETGYIGEYAWNRHAPDPKFLDLLQRAQERLRSRGIGFVVVMSPSKPAVVPESIPAGWDARIRPGRRQAELFVEECRQRGITLVDGHALTVAAKRPEDPPVFPLGGTHWGEQGSFDTARAILAALREQDLPVRDLTSFTPVRHENPVGEDADLVNLMNLVFPWHYPVLTVEVRPESMTPERQLNLTLVGASFTYALRRHLSASCQFAEIHQLLQRPTRRLWYGGEGDGTLDESLAVDVLGADCVVLEINEAGLWSPGLLEQVCKQVLVERDPQWRPAFRYASFVTEMPEKELTVEQPSTTLRLLVPPAAGGDLTLRLTVEVRQKGQLKVHSREGGLARWDLPVGVHELTFAVPARVLSSDGRLALHVESEGNLVLRKLTVQPAPALGFWARCRPGQVLRFALKGLDPGALVVFSAPEPSLIWTEGSSAEVGLQLPVRDRTLSFNVAPYLHPRYLPAQRVRVLANGHLAATWTFRNRNFEWRSVRVPAGWLGPEGRVTLRFELMTTCSPKEAGEGADPRQLGLLFRAVRVEREPNESAGARKPAAGSSRRSRPPKARKGKHS